MPVSIQPRPCRPPPCRRRGGSERGAAAERRTHVVAPARMATMRHNRLQKPRPSQGNVTKEGTSTVAFRHPEGSTAETGPVIHDSKVKNSPALEVFANDASSEQTTRSRLNHDAGERKLSVKAASVNPQKGFPATNPMSV